MSFNSVIIPEFGLHLLSFRQLHSYLAYKGICEHFDIRYNAFHTHLPNAEIAAGIRNQRPHIAAFSVYSWNVAKIKDICRRIKSGKKDTFIVWGGPYAAAVGRHLMTESDIDMIVKGEGEDVFYRVLESIGQNRDTFSRIPNLIYRNGHDIIETKEDFYFDISRQNYPLIIELDGAPIFSYETSRGCPFRCRFCCWDASGKGVRFFPEEKIEKDLAAILDLADVKNLYLCDSDLFIKKRHGIRVLRHLAERNRVRQNKGLQPVNISFEINLQYIDDRIIDALLELPEGPNFISCGLQTIDETINREHLNRAFDRVKYIGNLKRILEKSKQAGRFDGIKQNLKLEIIYGLPGETYEGFEQTFDFVISELEFSTFFCIRFEVLPGSYFWEHADDYQLVYEKEAPHYLLSSSTFSRKDMERAITLVFYYNLFTTILKGVQRVVDKNIRKNKLRIYKQIIRHISQHHPEFVSSLYRHFDPAYIESGFREKIDLYLNDKRYIDLRYQIIREAREIVMRHRD